MKSQYLIRFMAGCVLAGGNMVGANAQQVGLPATGSLLPPAAASTAQWAAGGQTIAVAPTAPVVQAAPATRLPATVAAPAGRYQDPSLSRTGFAQPTPAPPAPPADTAADDLDELRERLENAETELLKMRSESKSAADKLVEMIKGSKEAPKFPLIRLSGFMQVDDGLFSQNAASRAVYGDVQDGVGFRRARLQALGNLTEMTRYSIEMDFAIAGRPSFMDVWGEQAELPFFGTIRIGQFRQPTTMDGMTSIRHLDFLERNAAFQAMDPFRRVGIMAYRVADDEMSTLAYSVYATGFTFFNGTEVYQSIGDTRFGTQIGDSGGVSFAIRGTHLLYYDEPSEGRYLLHIGGGYNYSQIGGDGTTGTFAKTYEARSIPEFFVGDPTGGGLTAAGTPFVVDSGRVLANDFHFFHTELAGNYGAAHFQTEFLGTVLNQMGGADPLFYYGAYLQGGYFLTGESEGYNKQTGVADYNVKPYSEFFGTGKNGKMCGWGAWEVAARWSYLNISATPAPGNVLVPPVATVPPVPNAGVLNESTVALNWYWNQYTRVQFNWIHTMADLNLFGFRSLNTFGTRFQVEF